VQEASLSRRPTVIAWAALAVALIAPAGASATATVGVPALDFGTVPVGAASAPRSVGLSSSCTLPVTVTCPGFAVDAYYAHPSASGDFSANSDCSNPIGPSLTVLISSCTINVTFTPTAAGPRSGTLDTGTTDVTGLIPGPTVALAGAGVTPGAGGPGSGKPSDVKRKACKKKRRHRSAHAAKKKKCKKRKRS
jgi:hypothetical protein